MRRTLNIFLWLVALFTLSACGSDTADGQTERDADTNQSTDYIYISDGYDGKEKVIMEKLELAVNTVIAHMEGVRDRGDFHEYSDERKRRILRDMSDDDKRAVGFSDDPQGINTFLTSDRSIGVRFTYSPEGFLIANINSCENTGVRRGYFVVVAEDRQQQTSIEENKESQMIECR